MADDDKDWEDIPAKQSGAATAVADDDEWADVPASKAAPAPAVKPVAPPKPGAGQRFTESLRTGLGFAPQGNVSSDLGQIGEGLKHIALHPIDSASLLAHGLNDSQQAVIDKAYEEQHSPDLGTKARGYIRGAESAIPLLGPVLSHAGDQFRSGDVAGGLGTMTPILADPLAERAINAAPGVLDTLNAGRKSLAEKVVAPLIKKPLVAQMADIKFGRNAPGAIANEGLVAGSREALLDKVNERIGELGQNIDQQLQNHPNSLNRVDVEPMIDRVIDKGVQSAKKVANTAAITRLENLRNALKTEYGPTSGTPFEMNNFKRQVGEAASDLHAFKAEDPIEGSAASALADLYTEIKKGVNKEVPEVATINERIADLMGAKTGIARNIALHANKSSFPSLNTGIVGKALEGTLGSTPVRTAAARAINVGNVKDLPEITGTAPQPGYPAPIGPQPHLNIGTTSPSPNAQPFELNNQHPNASGLWESQVGELPTLGFSRFAEPGRAPNLAADSIPIVEGAHATRMPHIIGEQQPLNLPPENAPLFNIQQTPKLRGDLETQRLGPITGEQEPLNLAPPTAPLFNIPFANPRGGLRPIGGEPGPVPPAEPVAPEAPQGFLPRLGGSNGNVERYVRPPEVPAGMGKGPVPSEMHPEELAEIRKETGKPDLSIEDAHRYRLAKQAEELAERKPVNDLGGMKRAGEERPVGLRGGVALNPTVPPEIAKAIEPTGWKSLGRSETMGVTEFQAPNGRESITVLDKDLKPDIVLRKIQEKQKQFAPKPAGEVNF